MENWMQNFNIQSCFSTLSCSLSVLLKSSQNFPCAASFTARTEKAVNYCICCLVVIQRDKECQENNLRRRRWQVGVSDRWNGEVDFFILRTVSSVSSCQPVAAYFYHCLCVVYREGLIYSLLPLWESRRCMLNEHITSREMKTSDATCCCL